MPCGISERLISLRIRILKQEYSTLICAYAPTLDANFEAKVAFYQELERALRSTPNGDRIILLGDFNARVGRDYNIWPGVIGRHGLGNMNGNGELLLSMCAEHDLCINNTMFRQHNKFKGTWRHPRSGHWQTLDYIIVRRKDVKEVLSTKVRLDVECWTDHYLISQTRSTH